MTPEQEKAEREHCERAADDMTRENTANYVDIILRERAAAYQAGFEAGRKAGGK